MIDSVLRMLTGFWSIRYRRKHRRVLAKVYDNQTQEQRVFVETLGWTKDKFIDLCTKSGPDFGFTRVMIVVEPETAVAGRLARTSNWLAYCTVQHKIVVVHNPSPQIGSICETLRSMLHPTDKGRFSLVAYGQAEHDLGDDNAARSKEESLYRSQEMRGLSKQLEDLGLRGPKS